LIQLQNVLDDYIAAGGKGNDLDGETFEQRLKRVQDYLGKFPRAPFTLQRMAELLVEPKRYYSNPSKFFLAFSKLVCGISARNFDQEAAEEESESKKNSMSSFFNPPIPLAGSTAMDFTSSFSTTTVMPTTFASTSASSTLLSGTIATGPPVKKKKTEDDKDGVESGSVRLQVHLAAVLVVRVVALVLRLQLQHPRRLQRAKLPLPNLQLRQLRQLHLSRAQRQWIRANDNLILRPSIPLFINFSFLFCFRIFYARGAEQVYFKHMSLSL